MASAPAVSILLPTHNRPEVLDYAIQSVLAQTFADFELLVSGDGCTDQTAKVVRSFKDARVQWFDLPKAPNFGYANLNTVASRTRGGLIAFMAHDDLWTPDHLDLLRREFADPGVDLAYSRPLWVEPDGTLVPSSFNLRDAAVREDFLAMRFNSIPAATVVFRRECLQRYGNWNTELSNNGDWDLWARFITGGGGKRFSYVPLPTLFHFRANWRTEANAGPRELTAWRYRYRNQPDFGNRLRLTFPKRELPQKAVWNLMHRGGTVWVRNLRAAVQEALDRLVLDLDVQAPSLLDDMQAQAHELRRLRRTVARHDPGSLSGHDPSVFGDGFYPEENGIRWMGRQGLLHLRPEGALPATAVLTLACGDAAWYPRFPFMLRAKTNGHHVVKLAFTAPFQPQQLQVVLKKAENTVQLDSSGFFVPKHRDLSDDERELAVCLKNLAITAASKPQPGADHV
jgi:glycosyltransferase involved in cell wall biosynthesis